VEAEQTVKLAFASGDNFYIEPGHDSRVIGDEPYVSIRMTS
jgi:hypothetical protein